MTVWWLTIELARAIQATAPLEVATMDVTDT